mgnify:FL=1
MAVIYRKALPGFARLLCAANFALAVLRGKHSVIVGKRNSIAKSVLSVSLNRVVLVLILCVVLSLLCKHLVSVLQAPALCALISRLPLFFAKNALF